MTREQLLRVAATRAARLKQLDKQTGDAYDQVQDLRSRQEAGREIREGDRQGQHLSSQYFQRQYSLNRPVEQTRQHLDQLIAERDTLRY